MFPVHVEEAMAQTCEGFCEALTAETNILQKRVAAVASRCQVETAFLVTSNNVTKLNTKSPQSHHKRKKARELDNAQWYGGDLEYCCYCLLNPDNYAAGKHSWIQKQRFKRYFLNISSAAHVQI